MQDLEGSVDHPPSPPLHPFSTADAVWKKNTTGSTASSGENLSVNPLAAAAQEVEAQLEA